MVDLTVLPLSPFDTLLASITAVVVYIVLGIALQLEKQGYHSWAPRKLIHISISSIIGVTLVMYNHLSGPILAIVFFVGPLLLGRLLFGQPVWKIVRMASREKEGQSSWNTLAAGILALIAYGIVFLSFPNEPAVFVTAILAVSWGDGSGEVIGRPFGSRKYRFQGNERTIEGSIAVFVFTLIAACFSFLAFSTRPILALLPIFVIVSSVVSLVEAVSISWMDNFLIPISVAGILFFFLYWF